MSWQNITRDPGERGGSYCSLGREYEAARLALTVPQQERPVASLVEDGVGPLAGDEAVVVAHCFPATHSRRKLLHAIYTKCRPNCNTDSRLRWEAAFF